MEEQKLVLNRTLFNTHTCYTHIPSKNDSADSIYSQWQFKLVATG